MFHDRKLHFDAPPAAQTVLHDRRRPERFIGRSRVRDGLMTFDSTRTHDGRGNMLGLPLGASFTRQYQTRDGRTIASTYDTTGAFLVGELERLDMTLHMPLAEVSFGRDVDIRTDVSVADDISSFTLSTFGSAGGLGTGNSIGSGKAWAGRNTTQITGVSVDIGKKVFPLRPWAVELAYDVFELASAAKVGRPIDQQKFEALQLKHQMDIDEQVYYGDVNGDTGITNNSLVTNINNLPAGAQGPTTWVSKSPAEILQDINGALVSTWAASAWAVIPSRILLPPAQFGYIATQLVSIAGSISILKYIQENNLLTTSGRGKINIFPVKWLIGAGVGGTIGTVGTDRMMVYTKDRKFIRYPMTLLERTPVQYDGLYHKSTYYGKLGVVECVYPQTVSYWDGL